MDGFTLEEKTGSKIIKGCIKKEYAQKTYEGLELLGEDIFVKCSKEKKFIPADQRREDLQEEGNVEEIKTTVNITYRWDGTPKGANFEISNLDYLSQKDYPISPTASYYKDRTIDNAVLNMLFKELPVEYRAILPKPQG